MQIQYLKIDQITPYEKNPRKNEAAIAPVMESIKQFGFKSPIIVDKDNIIINGHTRYKAARRLGLDTVPVIIATDLTPEQVKAFRLADNKTAEFAEWDFDLLDEELKSLLDFDMSVFGFEDPEEVEEKEPEEDDYEPVPPPIPKTQPGEIYQLGEHRLMCGDSTEEKDVWALMDKTSADLFLTDPPYNVDYEGKTKEKLKIKSDKMGSESFLNFLTGAFKNAKEVMKQGAAFYIWHADANRPIFQAATDAAGLIWHQTIIWVKQVFTLGRQDYQWIHEPCLYGWTEGAAHYFIDKRNLITVFEDIVQNIDSMKKEEMKKLLHDLLDTPYTTAWHEDRPTKSELHPTMKPIKLMARSIQNSTKPGEIVLDLFGGSGSTLIACEQLARKCYMMELDPRYCDVIIDRWEQFTGGKAVLLNPKKAATNE